MQHTQSSHEDQRRQAIIRANEVRVARARLRRRIASGELTAAELIANPPSEANSWPVGEVLAAQHGWGPGRTQRTLNRLEVRETKPLGTLTARQRRLITDTLAPPTPRTRNRAA